MSPILGLLQNFYVGVGAVGGPQKKTIHIDIYIYTYIHTYIHTFVDCYIHTHMYRYIDIHAYIYVHVYASYIHAYMHKYTYTHTHIHTHKTINVFIMCIYIHVRERERERERERDRERERGRLLEPFKKQTRRPAPQPRSQEASGVEQRRPEVVDGLWWREKVPKRPHNRYMVCSVSCNIRIYTYS